MTFDELDEALRRLGLNLKCEAGQETKKRIIAEYGKHVLRANEERCSKCWYKANKKTCSLGCPVKSLPNDPYEAGFQTLSRSNDVNLMSFVVMFVFPIYEHDTGNTNTLEKLGEEFRKRWQKEHPEQDSDY